MPPKKKPKLVARKRGRVPRRRLAARPPGDAATLRAEASTLQAELDVRAARAMANARKRVAPAPGAREVYALKIAREYRGREDLAWTAARGLYASWGRCCAAAEEFMAREGRREWTHDSDGESYAEEDLPEVRDVTAEERAAGPPLAVGDEVTFVAATAGDYPSHRTMRVFADSHVLYE